MNKRSNSEERVVSQFFQSGQENLFLPVSEYLIYNIAQILQQYFKSIASILQKYCISLTTAVIWRSMRAKILQEYFKNIAKILRYIDNSGHMAEYASYAKNEDNEVIVSAAHDHTQSVFHHRSLSFPLFLSL